MQKYAFRYVRFKRYKQFAYRFWKSLVDFANRLTSYECIFRLKILTLTCFQIFKMFFLSLLLFLFTKYCDSKTDKKQKRMKC
jgi:hypothetical protein